MRRPWRRGGLAVLLVTALSAVGESQHVTVPSVAPAPTTGTGDWVRATAPTFSGAMTFSSGATAVFPNTTFASQGGILYKGATPWLHDFNYGNNGTVTTEGGNTFLGGAGNLTMGSTAVAGSYEASRITAVGYLSGAAITTAYNATLVGREAGKSLTTGCCSTAVGYLALRDATTGTGNTAIGSSALYRSSGSYNISIGMNSMSSSNSGSTNVAIGYNALPNLSTGSNNVVIGASAPGAGITTGTENTILGYTPTLSGSLSKNVILASGDGSVRARAVPEFSLTDNTATTFAVLTLGNDTGGGGSFDYCVYAQDATTGGLECGRIDFAGIDVTAGAGGEVCPNPTKVGTPLQALSGSTLSVTFTATTGTDLCNIKVTADTDIATPVALNIKWWVVNSGRTLTPQ